MNILFEDAHYQAVEIAGDESQPFVITFSPWGKLYDPRVARNFERAFGLRAIAEIGLNCISLVTNKNDWYQGKSVHHAIKAIKQRIPAGSTIITYGSSMGGFAAINFAEALDADFFIALSPQASIKKSFMDSFRDRRFRREVLTVAKHNDYILTDLNASRRGYIFFDDKFQLDAAHAIECAARSKGTLVPISYSGHHTAAALNRCYGLKKVVEEVARGAFSQDAISLLTKKNEDYSLNALAANLDRTDDFCRRYLETPDEVSMDTIELLIEAIVSSPTPPPFAAIAMAVNLLLLKSELLKRKNPARHQKLFNKLGNYLEKNNFCGLL